MRRFGLYAALALCIYGLPATAEERFERWSLEQPGGFSFGDPNALEHNEDVGAISLDGAFCLLL